MKKYVRKLVEKQRYKNPAAFSGGAMEKTAVKTIQKFSLTGMREVP